MAASAARSGVAKRLVRASRKDDRLHRQSGNALGIEAPASVEIHNGLLEITSFEMAQAANAQQGRLGIVAFAGAIGTRPG